MANPDSAPVTLTTPLEKKENLTPISSKIGALSESRSELLMRIQGLKKDLQSWRSLDTQVTIYRDEFGNIESPMYSRLRHFFATIYSRMQVKPSMQPIVVSIPICHYDLPSMDFGVWTKNSRGIYSKWDGFARNTTQALFGLLWTSHEPVDTSKDTYRIHCANIQVSKGGGGLRAVAESCQSYTFDHYINFSGGWLMDGIFAE